MKSLTKINCTLRLLTLLCLLVAWTGAQADWYVAGSPATTVFNGSWNASGDKMMQVGGSDYLFLKPNVASGTSISFKVTNGSWNESYPGNNYNFTQNSLGTFAIKFNSDSKTVNAYTITTWTIAGDNGRGLIDNSWSTTDTNYDMTSTDGDTYTLTLTNRTLTAGTQQYKVCGNHAWNVSVGSGTQNASLNIPSAGVYDVTFTFKVSTMLLSATATPVSSNSFTVNVYDASGAPKVNGTTLSNTTSGTNCQWYTYTYEDTTLPSSVTVESSTGATATLSNPANGQTYYYAWNGYTVQSVGSDYDPNRRNLIYWPDGSNYSDGTQATLTTTDGINYTVSGLSLAGNDWLVFTTAFTGGWDADKGSFYGASSNVTISEDSGNGTGVKGQTGIIHVTKAGIWSFTYNIITNAWTATRTGDLPQNTYTIHVIEYKGETPYLYVFNAGSANSASFPGAEMTETEVSAAGETWYKTTLSTTASTISVIASLGGSSSQTADITGIAPGDYYIVFNGTTKEILSQGTTMPEGKVQAEKNAFTVYVKADAAPYVYAWKSNNQAIGNAMPGIQLTDSVETLADGNAWYKITYETNEQSLNFLLNDGNSGNGHQSGDITQTKSVAYYVYDGATKCIETAEPTGKLYAIGQVAGNPWSATMGKEMTAAGNGIFTLSNVQIIAGSTFAFATRMADESLEGDAAWAMLNSYRLTSNPGNGGTFWGVTNAMTNKDNPQALDLRIWNGADKNFKMDETAYYDITVNMNTMTVTIKRASDALYMYYGSHWAPNAGVPMISTDGVTYTLSNVTLAEGATFQFTKALGPNATTWPANEYRLGSAAQGEYWEVTTDELDIVLENALMAGSTKDFKMAEGTAGTYRVVVNPTAMTVALYHMATVLDGKTIIHLEKTSNVTDPVLWAYDKETLAETGERIHVDRPSRKDIYDTRVKLTPKVLEEVTTVDGRKWWAWEVENSITDFWFTREPYHYDGSNATNDNMTDIQWRKSGEIYFTWPTAGTKLEEYTRDYYAAAAQEAAECAVMIEGHMYAYFTNTPGWEHVFCHAWNTDAQGVNHDLLTPPTSPDGLSTPRYPGALCELVGYDKDGYEVWRIDLTAAGVTTYPNGGILFNNGIDKPKDTKWDYFTGEEATIDKEQTGDFAYSTGACYDYCGLIVLGRSLSNIIRNGVVNGPVYTIEDDIVGVWFDPKAVTEIEVDGEIHTMYGALYCKDLNNFVTTPYVEKSLQKEGEIDYMLQRTNLMAGKNRYDQSNWVKLTLSTQYPNYESKFKNKPDEQKVELSKCVGFVLPAESVRGQLVNNYNPEMRLALQALPESNTENNYSQDPNVFVTANFIGTQDCTEAVNEYGHEERNTYFMVTPKPQEYAKITWAVYAGDNKFYIPKRGSYAFVDGKYEWMNEGDLNGYFPVQWDLQSNPGLVENQAYSFRAIIRLADQEQAASTGGTTTLRAAQESVPYKPYDGTVKYVVSPIDLSTDDIITAVTDINATTKTVRQVRYYNLAGIESTEPFDGINVVVTTYTDGSKSTAKILK